MIRLVVTTTSRPHRPIPTLKPTANAVGGCETGSAHPAAALAATDRHCAGTH
ncbi:hypothetical protein G6M89_14140 [Natronolimnobius sp. AArcel1]|uniref:hypothetical protein n=1 Tax=Natronolimnobius sp. AArcel1 TaxID=1679093 RepID=UPI0013E9E07F|nr:hypothetical protein [Natronolimnobius sp. AArcel1]NGM70133.1 hypothetical protein [Natronolimnobius sp. AArcel1]